MCGRYSVAPAPGAQDIAAIFDAASVDDIAVRYNVAPSQNAPVVRLNAAGEREIVMLRWGFIPSWAKEIRVGLSSVNARAETVATKATFRDAFAKRRCLVVATGFYEWRTEVRERDLFGNALSSEKQAYNIVPTGEGIPRRRWLIRSFTLTRAVVPARAFMPPTDPPL